MGRIRNAILDKQHEFEEDLATLRQQLADKESECLHFEIQQCLDSLRDEIWIIKNRLDALEEKQRVKLQIHEKSHKTLSPKLVSLLGVILAISVICYRCV